MIFDAPSRYPVMTILNLARKDLSVEDIYKRLIGKGLKPTAHAVRLVLFRLKDAKCVASYPVYDGHPGLGRKPHAYYLLPAGRVELDVRNIRARARWLKAHRAAWRRP